jgi:uncharacterized repeat protein (TIGR01451 family)
MPIKKPTTPLNNRSSHLYQSNLIHKFSFLAVALLIGFQLVVNLAPAVRTNASSSNDIVNGGIGDGDPRANLLRVYDQDRDQAGNTGFQTMYTALGIQRSDLERTRLTTVSSSDPSLIAVNRNHTFAEDHALQVPTDANLPDTPEGCSNQLPFTRVSNGQCILYIQRLLNDLNYNLTENGQFDSALETALRSFQRSYGIPETGIVDHNTWVRLHQAVLAVASSSGSQTFYLRPLALWNPDRDPVEYEALVGRTVTGNLFYIIVKCGNPVMPSSNVPPTVTPPPSTTPPPPPPVEQIKTAVYLNQATALSSSAHNTTAKAGDIIRYTLLTHNHSQAPLTNFAVTEQLADVLEYADIIDLGGGTLSGNTLTWPRVTIAPGSNLSRSFVIKVKSPVPDTAISISDPKSFDLRMDNVYGNLISIKLQAPPAKQIEAIVRALPRTGRAVSVAGISFFSALAFYFYFRHRQLLRETSPY